MKNIVNFTDRTVEQAIRLKLPADQIELIYTIMQKYSVSCYDITLNTYRQYIKDFQLKINSSMRCLVSASVEEVSDAKGFKQLLVNWNHKKGGSLNKLYEAANAAKNQDLFLKLENAQNLETYEFEQYFKWAKVYGAKGFIYSCDAAEDVFSMNERLCSIVENAPCPIEFESSNEYGIATALSLAALKAGVSRVGASVAGVDGSTPLEEVLMAAKHLWLCDIFAGCELAADFQKILSMLGLATPVKKALIGSEVFAHESGIHVDGINKNPSLYEIIRPEDVGLKRQFVIGKHSGTLSLKIKFKQWNIELSSDESAVLLTKVRKLAQFQKGALSDNQLIDLYEGNITKGGVNHECCKII
jgi:homocitrate synthase NifV